VSIPGPIGAAGVPEASPELGFAVEAVAPLSPAAVPTLRFSLRVDAGGAAIRSVVLDVQIQIAATRRRYGAAEQEALADLFGTPERWGETLRTLPWMRATLAVPPFEGAALVHLDVPCTYDFEVGAARYLAALGDGAVPLELLFSGTVFYLGASGAIQINRISWSAEAAHRLPVRVWRETMDHYFPNAAWLRLQRDTFERLVAFRARNALTSWEAVVAALLEGREAER
jgi:hypothetical protein